MSFSDMSFNFNKHRASNINSLITLYDFRSMMHYGAYAFGGGRRTIETKDPIYQRIIGQRSGFSSIDIKQINLVCCGGMCYTKPFSHKEEGYMQCRCREAYVQFHLTSLEIYEH